MCMIMKQNNIKKSLFLPKGLCTNHVDKGGGGGCQNVHVCLRGGGGGSWVCLRRQNIYQFQRIFIVKYQFLQGLLFLQTQS